MQEPFLIQFDQLGNPETGFLSVAQHQEHLPFDVKRIFWMYHVPDFAERGNHAYHHTEQVLIVLHGAVKIKLEGTMRRKFDFELYSPDQGLFIPPRYWRHVQFFDEAVVLLLSSQEYKEEEYIRDYAFFKTLKN